jgi:GH25 family lysozyme M1 (1,4-beta-N-acetylmuramidase)
MATDDVLTGVTVEPLESRFLMARVPGIDVSHYQGTINWSSVFAAGKKFAFTKATEGTTYLDPTLATNANGGKNAGVLTGVYHFARPDTSSNDAVNEANWFVSKAKQFMTTGFLHPVLDLEAGSGLGKTVLSQWVNSFCTTVRNAVGVDPIIYCNTNYASNFFDSSVTSHDLWIANWSTSYGDPLTTGSPPIGVWSGAGQTWDFWQYADNGTVAGISGAVDLDVYHGDINALKSNFLVGYNAPGIVTGSVFLDVNGNGQLNTGEPPLSGRTVYVDANNNSALDTGEKSTTTNSSGVYSFSLNPGTYQIRQVLPTGWYQTVPFNKAARSATVTSGQTTSVFAFGATQVCSIGGSVYQDKNNSNTYDAGDTPLSGWTVYFDSNNNGQLDSGERYSVTGNDGKWRITNLGAGPKIIRVVPKVNFTLKNPSNGTLSFNLTSGSNITTANFGVV